MTGKKLTIAALAVALAAAIIIMEAPSIAARGQQRGRAGAQGQRGAGGPAMRGQQGGMRGQMGARAGMRNFDRTEMMKNMLQIDDAKWPTVKPKLAKVMEIQRDLEGGRGFGRGMMAMMGRGRGRTDRPGADAPRGRGRQARPGADDEDQPREQTAIEKATDALRQTLTSASPNNDDITANLTALRKARAEAKKKLDAAQKDLAADLTLEQQARAVLMNILD